MGLSLYDPDAPKPYREALCAPSSDISSGEPCPFTKVPDGPRLKIFMFSGSKEGTQIYYPFLSKKSQQANPLQVPQDVIRYCNLSVVLVSV
jgi:hypothetical protein